MQFSADDIAVMLDMLGDSVLIGAASTVGIFSEPGKREDVYTGNIITTAPVLLLSSADAATVTENSTIITIGGTQYQAFEKVPEGDGFMMLALTKDF